MSSTPGASPQGAATDHRVSRLSRAASVGLFVVGLAIGIGIVVTQTDSTTGLLDLRIYLGAAETWRSGHSLYDFSQPTFGLGSTYPPLWTVLVASVAWAPVGMVELGWTMANLLLWLVTLERLDRTVIRGLGQRLTPPIGDATVSFERSVNRVAGYRDRTRLGPPTRWLGLLLVWLLSLATAPVWNTLNQGQVNVLLWFLVVGDLFAHAMTGEDTSAPPDRGLRWIGWRTGVATALKLLPAIGIVGWALAGRGRVAARAAVVAVVVTAAAAAFAPADSWRYFTSLVLQSDRVGSLTAAENNSLAGLLSRLGIDEQTSVVCAAGLVAVLLWRCRGVLRRCVDEGRIVEVAMVVGLAGALASPISWTHHLVFLCFPLLWWLRMPSWSTALRWTVILGGVVVLVDPIGFGRSGLTSSARTVAMAAALVIAPSLSRRNAVSQRRRTSSNHA